MKIGSNYLRDWWQRVAIVGSVFAFLETLLVYGTGQAAPWDSCIIFPLSLVLWIIAALVLNVAVRILFSWSVSEDNQTVEWVNSVALLLAPVLLFGARGSFAHGTADAGTRRLAITAVLLLVILLAGWLSWKSRPGPVGATYFLFLSVVGQGVAGFALAARSVGFPEHAGIGGVWLITVYLVYAVMCLLAVKQAASAKGDAGGRIGLLSAVSAIMVVFLYAKIPSPSFGASQIDAEGEESANQPNVLLIVLDTVRRDHLSSYGYWRNTTPNIDSLARNATLFENGYSTASYTLPSHASLMTGQLPSEHGAHAVPYSIQEGRSQPRYTKVSEDTGTLAERFSRRGYRTGAIAANFSFLDKSTGLGKGFDYYDASAERLYRYIPVVLSLVVRLPARFYHYLSLQSTRPASVITEEAIQWLEDARGHNFFLFLNYMDAHLPYLPPAPYDSRFLQSENHSFPVVDQDVRSLSASDRAYVLAQYDGCIAFADAEVGRLLRWLESRGLLDEMVVIVTSDHGEFFGEHGFVDHAKSLYEEVLQIPLIIKFPNQQNAVKVSHRVGLHQVPAMLSRVLYGDIDPASVVESLELTEPTILAEAWNWERGSDLRRPKSPAMRAIYEGPWKLIHTTNDTDELYDLSVDPGESRNLFETDRDLSQAQETSMTRDLPDLSVVSTPRQRELANPEVMERLRALGYVR